MRRRVSAASRIEVLCTAGTASNYIRDFKLIQRGTKVVLCLRVSGCTQQQNKNLDDSESFLRKELEQIGAIVVGVIRHVGSGWDPEWLLPAVRLGKKHGAVLLAESTDRFIRNPYYHSRFWQNGQASELDLQYLRRTVGDATLVTWLHPDATPAEIRSHQRKRGQEAKGNKGGRPKKKKAGYKKELREEWKPQVLLMHREGNSIPDIMRITKLKRRTIYNWIKESKAAVPFLQEYEVIGSGILS